MTVTDRQGISFVQGRIAGVEPMTRHVSLQGGATMPYDLAVLDAGSHNSMPDLPGFADHGVPIKPLDGFAARLAMTRAAACATIIGGGVAGAEIALALRHRGALRVTVIEAGPLIGAALSARSRRHLTAAFGRSGIRVVTDAEVAAVHDDAVVLREGTRIASSLTIGIAGARAHGWMARSLPVDSAGFVRVTPTPQVEGHPTVFAAGDCAAMMHAPRPKAGVFAVRQERAGVTIGTGAAALRRGSSHSPLLHDDHRKAVQP